MLQLNSNNFTVNECLDIIKEVRPQAEPNDGFIKEIEARLDRLNIPKSLSEIGVPMDCSSRIADKAMLDSAASTNPVAGDSSNLTNLIEQAITQAR